MAVAECRPGKSQPAPPAIPLLLDTFPTSLQTAESLPQAQSHRRDGGCGW
jgi:hypothetical protein